MQPWPDQGQNGTDGHSSWHSSFMFSAPAGQFDPNQEQWPDQSLTGQAGAFSQIGHDLADGSAPEYDFDAVHHGHAGAFLGDQHMSNSQAGQAGFPGAGNHLNQHQQYSSGNQDMLDPAFSSIHSDLFSQQDQPHSAKVNLVGAGMSSGGMGQIGMGQGQNHTQVFAQHEYPYTPQSGQPFNPPSNPTQVTQFSPPSLMARPSPSRQHSHTPMQQPHFDANNNIHPNFPQNQAFARPQHSPLHSHRQPQTQAPQQQQHQTQQFTDQPFASPINGRPDRFQVDSHAHVAYPQFQDQSAQPQLQQTQFQQPSFGTQKRGFPQQGPGSSAVSVDSQKQAEQQQPPSIQGPPAVGHIPSVEIDSAADSSLVSSESPAKKRKRVTKSAPEVVTAASESPAPTNIDPTPADAALRKLEETASLQAPVASAEEAGWICESAKRAKSAKAKIPNTKALPHLAYSGSIKLPVPKSYDKLSPLVAVPPLSGKSAIQGLAYELPCEIQGRFTSQYRPAFDKPGLDERREEAKALLDNYDRSMRALGKRQPKYTEYPHAFKEQLKADEASKNKAEKKAKKEMEEERNKPIRAATRPTDPAAAAAWDMVGIVHIDQSVARTSALIAGRVQQAGEFLIKLRGEANRAKLALDQAVKDKKSEAELAKLRQEADQKKEMLYQALDATVEHADDAVLDNLGGHQKLVLSLVNTLISCIKAADFSGKLSKIVLELFTHLAMTRKIVETTNFDTIRKRLEDKGDDEVKDLVREISSKIRKFNKSNESDTTTGYTGTSAASRAKTSTKSSGAADPSSTKRARDDDVEVTRNVKKIAVEPGSSSLSKKLAQPKSQPQSVTRVTSTSASKPTTSLLPGKPRPVAKAALKPQELSATADSPSASADEKKPDAKRAIARPESKIAAVKKETKPSGALGAVSSISSLLDSINAKKPDPLLAVAAAGARDGKRSETPETAEQTAKRLRKEARRRLRVTWKPEAELVQVKVFEKDENENEGRDSNMLRDAADDRSEGMMLKRGANVSVEDEEDEPSYRPWTTPDAVDLSKLPEGTRNKNYVTRGGHVGFSTEEQKHIAAREQRELMVIYTDPTDIPPTPKSPLPGTAVSDVEAKHVQLPDEGTVFNEIRTRWKEADHLGCDQAVIAAMKRVNSKNHMSTKLDSILGRLNQTGGTARASSSAVAANPSTSFKNSNVPLAIGPAVETYVLGWLQWDRISAWRDPNPIHADPAQVFQLANPELQGVVDAARSLAGKHFPPSTPPEWLMKDGERVREWWLGYNKDTTARQRKIEEKNARAEAEAQALGMMRQGSNNGQDWAAYYTQQQHQAYAPYMALLQQMTGAQQAQPQAHVQAQASIGGAAHGQQPHIPDSQLQSILAAINQPGQQQQHPAMAQSSNVPGYDVSYQQYSQTGLTSTHSGDREWDRNEKDSHKGDGKDGRKKKATLPPHKPVNKALIGTKPCTFWQQGKCARGDKCTFRHD